MTSPQAERLARCSCGQLQAWCTGEPVRVAVCHCSACRLRTGSAFSVNATFRAEQVRHSGDFRTFTRQSATDRACRFHFCPLCGATVFFDIEARPGMISIPSGVFETTFFPAPGVEVYSERRVAWCTLDLANGGTQTA